MGPVEAGDLSLLQNIQTASGSKESRDPYSLWIQIASRSKQPLDP